MKKTVKTQREICKKWGLHGFEETYATEKEFDVNGNLIHSRTIYDPFFYETISDDEYSPLDEDDPEEDLFMKYDDDNRMIERKEIKNGESVVDSYTFDSEGRELSHTHTQNAFTIRFDFIYEVDEKGRQWKYCTLNGNTEEKYTYQVKDKDGKILYDTEPSFNDESVHYESFKYTYDELGRLTDVYSYVGGDEGYSDSGEVRHIEYVDEENGVKKTLTTVRTFFITEAVNDIMAVLEDPNIWVIDGPDLYETDTDSDIEITEDYSLLSKKTKKEWRDKSSINTEEIDDLTGEKSIFCDCIDDNGVVYKTCHTFFNKDGSVESLSVILKDNNGNEVDKKIYKGFHEELLQHHVNHYSDDGLILMSSVSLIVKNQGLGDNSYEELISWFDYSFFDE